MPLGLRMPEKLKPLSTRLGRQKTHTTMGKIVDSIEAGRRQLIIRRVESRGIATYHINDKKTGEHIAAASINPDAPVSHIVYHSKEHELVVNPLIKYLKNKSGYDGVLEKRLEEEPRKPTVYDRVKPQDFTGHGRYIGRSGKFIIRHEPPERYFVGPRGGSPVDLRDTTFNICRSERGQEKPVHTLIGAFDDFGKFYFYSRPVNDLRKLVEDVNRKRAKRLGQYKRADRSKKLEYDASGILDVIGKHMDNEYSWAFEA